MKRVSDEAPGLRGLDDVLEEIRRTFQGCAGIQGFSVTGRFEHSARNIAFGDLKLRRQAGKAARP